VAAYWVTKAAVELLTRFKFYQGDQGLISLFFQRLRLLLKFETLPLLMKEEQLLLEGACEEQIKMLLI